ncbi:MAG: 4Fe-4S dicluster domain-containing protein [Ruminococcus sp.]|jgi:ferredoxin
MLKKTNLCCFSPTGGTRNMGEIFCRDISEETFVTDLMVREEKPQQEESDLTVIAAPVFGGRIPSTAADRIKELNGVGKKAVVLAVYGVRAYEDALLELKDLAEEQGFQVVAGAALVTRHSIVPQVGADRPDEKDLEQIRTFAAQVEEKLAAGGEEKVQVPGGKPYKAPMQVAATPVSMEGCVQCQACVKVCPTGAAALKDGQIVTELEKCILCMACTAVCPKKVRVLPAPMQEGMNAKLGPLKEVHRENEFFI